MQVEADTTSADAGNDAAVMASLGIARVSVDYFHWNGYRYTALNDAIAAARRAQSRPLADV